MIHELKEDREAQLQGACYEKLSLTLQGLWKPPEHFSVSICIYRSTSLHLLYSSCIQGTYSASVYLLTQSDAGAYQHKLLGDLDWFNKQKAFACWIFYDSMLDSFHLSVSWPSRLKVSCGLEGLFLFGKRFGELIFTLPWFTSLDEVIFLKLRVEQNFPSPSCCHRSNRQYLLRLEKLFLICFQICVIVWSDSRIN